MRSAATLLVIRVCREGLSDVPPQDGLALVQQRRQLSVGHLKILRLNHIAVPARGHCNTLRAFAWGTSLSAVRSADTLLVIRVCREELSDVPVKTASHLLTSEVN